MSAPGMSILQPLSFALGVGMAFVLTPWVYLWSWPWITARVAWLYSFEAQTYAPWIWWLVLLVAIYGLTRLGLHLLFSMLAAGLTLGLFSRRRR